LPLDAYSGAKYLHWQISLFLRYNVSKNNFICNCHSNLTTP
jgi:hypothetical protein